MNVTKVDNLKMLHHQPLELIEDVPENKYLHIMIVLANLTDATSSLQNEEERAPLILAQYKAGLQSILLLGEESGFEAEWIDDYPHLKVSGELSNHFMQVLEAVVLFRVKKSAVMFKALLTQYLQLGKMLGLELAEFSNESY